MLPRHNFQIRKVKHTKKDYSMCYCDIHALGFLPELQSLCAVWRLSLCDLWEHIWRYSFAMKVICYQPKLDIGIITVHFSLSSDILLKLVFLTLFVDQLTFQSFLCLSV